MKINKKSTYRKGVLALAFLLIINASYGQAAVALSIISKNDVTNSLVMGYAVSTQSTTSLWVPPPGAECIDDITANCFQVDFLIQVTTTIAGVTTNLFPNVDYAPIALSEYETPLVATKTPVNYTFDLCNIYTFTVGQTYNVTISYNKSLFNNTAAVVPSNVVTFTY